jgi:hypothetical protein
MTPERLMDVSPWPGRPQLPAIQPALVFWDRRRHFTGARHRLIMTGRLHALFAVPRQGERLIDGT